MTNINYSQTLKRIANDPLSFYNGSLADDVVSDIKDLNGIISREDLANYEPIWKSPILCNLTGKYYLYTVRPPSRYRRKYIEFLKSFNYRFEFNY